MPLEKENRKRNQKSMNGFKGPPRPYMWHVHNKYWLVWLPDSTGGKRLTIMGCEQHQDLVNEKNLEWHMLLPFS